MSGIPLLDPSSLGNLGALRSAFSEYGILHIDDHGIDPEDLRTLYQTFAAFCAQPESEKHRIERPDLWYQRGWSPPNTEYAIAAGGQPDFKECFFAALNEASREDNAQFPEIHAANVWPEGLDAFPAQLHRVAAKLQALGNLILRSAALSLDLEADTFTRLLADGPHVSRLLRYLPLREDQLGQDLLWGENHTDFCALTLLPGGLFLGEDGAPLEDSSPTDPGAGLFLTARGGEVVSGTPPEGSLVVQVGQQLEILTGGRFVATPHGIRAPRRAGIARISCAHFMHMGTRELLFPLPPFQNAESVERYRPPVLVGTYDLSVLADIQLAPPSARDRLGYPNQNRIVPQRTAEKPLTT